MKLVFCPQKMRDCYLAITISLTHAVSDNVNLGEWLFRLTNQFSKQINEIVTIWHHALCLNQR